MGTRLFFSVNSWVCRRLKLKVVAKRYLTKPSALPPSRTYNSVYDVMVSQQLCSRILLQTCTRYDTCTQCGCPYNTDGTCCRLLQVLEYYFHWVVQSLVASIVKLIPGTSCSASTVAVSIVVSRQLCTPYNNIKGMTTCSCCCCCSPPTFVRPLDPPHAIHPCAGFHAKLSSFVPFGIAIFLLKYMNMPASPPREASLARTSLWSVPALNMLYPIDPAQARGTAALLKDVHRDDEGRKQKKKRQPFHQKKKTI